MSSTPTPASSAQLETGARIELSLTATATDHATALWRAEGADPATKLRVAVQPGGCNGYQYDLSFDDRDLDGDTVLTFGELPVVIDHDSATRLSRASIDYQDGLNGKGFVIDNQHATKTCGCGSSFC
jgi:iron-sulfur cluster assembly accessory protein